MDAYSVPCAPATRARVGPGFAPQITATGIFVPTSLPADTSMKPVTVCAVTAVAVPTVSAGCCAVARHAQNATQKNQCQPIAHTRFLHATLESRRSITPEVESYTGPLLSPPTCAWAHARQTPALPNRRIHAISSIWTSGRGQRNHADEKPIFSNRDYFPSSSSPLAIVAKRQLPTSQLLVTNP